MRFIGNDHTIREFGPEGELSMDPGTRLRPRHCGDDMQLTMHGAADAGGSLPPGLDSPGPDLRLVWQCLCGFRLDAQPDPCEKVWAAAAAVETCQWEMDHAVQQLRQALRTASAMGATDELLAESAQLPRDELQMILGQADGRHPRHHQTRPARPIPPRRPRHR